MIDSEVIEINNKLLEVKKTIFKIRRKSDGLYALKGSSLHDFGAKGHEFTSLGNIRCHVANCKDKYSTAGNFEVISFEYVLARKTATDLKDF